MESGIYLNTSEDLQTVDKEVLLSSAPESKPREQSTPLVIAPSLLFP